ncbi:unnamed protein product [Moneuplotes crassus]|uniref:Uncharacterized protein n=1 Tax=Euplotes crassus TaxID=5936 RepID=A0AAD1U4Z2_EUPCR|nr:unnamed protein product [Moneuplotes crassus]
MSDKSISLLSVSNEMKFQFNQNLFSDDLTVAQTPQVVEEELHNNCGEKDLRFNFDQEISTSTKELHIFDNEAIGHQDEYRQSFIWEQEMHCDIMLDHNSLSIARHHLEKDSEEEKQPEEKIKVHFEMDSIKDDQTLKKPKKTLKKPKSKKKVNTGLRKRKDVVFKSLLRKIRSYYWKNFNDITHFNILKKKNLSHTLYYECLKIYLETEFGTRNPAVITNELILTLGDLMTSDGASGRDINEAYLTLYKFSIARLIRLCKNPDFMMLIHHFSDVFEGKKLTKDERKGLQMIKDEALLSSHQ